MEYFGWFALFTAGVLLLQELLECFGIGREKRLHGASDRHGDSGGGYFSGGCIGGGGDGGGGGGCGGGDGGCS